MEANQRIMIIGGTSGIGLALAEYYLKEGHFVGVCGRDATRLPPKLLQQHPNLKSYQLDVCDKPTLAAALKDFGSEGLSSVFTFAGTFADSRFRAVPADEAWAVLDSNIHGTLNVFEASRDLLAKKGGQIVAIATVSALFSYSLHAAAKAAVLKICDAYRIALAPLGVGVTALVSGYVDTEAMRSVNGGTLAHKPFVLSIDQAIREITFAVDGRKMQHVFPWQMRLTASLLRALPMPLRKSLLPKKA